MTGDGHVMAVASGVGGAPMASELRRPAAQGARAMRCAEVKSADLLIARDSKHEDKATVLSFAVAVAHVTPARE
eukprot:999146-Pleurochrysis_carterae.AAC.2